MAKAAKKIILTIPGDGRIDALPGGSFDPGGVSRSPMTTQGGKTHYSEEDVHSSVSCRVPNLKGRLESLRDIVNVNINVQDDNGDSWIITDAFNTQPPSVSGGEISLELAGNKAEPV
ncbi:MAG: phage tail tube protein [Pseudomonadales bacterium]